MSLRATIRATGGDGAVAPPMPAAVGTPLSRAGLAGQGGDVPDESDELLIRNALRGNPAAFEKLASAYDRAILGFLLALTTSEQDALDLCHATMLAAYHALASPRTCSLYIWMHRLAVAQWLAWTKQAGDKASPGDRCARALHQLSARERLVFTLKAGRQLALRTVAQILDEPEETLARTFTRAVAKLQWSLPDSH